jgi:hypothetical protein
MRKTLDVEVADKCLLRDYVKLEPNLLPARDQEVNIVVVLQRLDV